MIPKLSLINPSRNNLKYLEWSYNSVRKNLSKDVEYCVADDASSDTTKEWCENTAKKDPLFKYIVNEGPKRLGHTILYDKLISEVATSDKCMIWHSDMYACPGLDDNILKYLKPGIIVSATRIEPPLHPPGIEKIILDCGIEPEEFDENKLFEHLKILKQNIKQEYTEGIFAPWAFYKKDFQEIGGHDILFAPQSKEDSDIFNRFKLNGIKFVQTWEGFVYHMTCRGSRFANGAKRNPDGQVFMSGRETDEWLIQNEISTKNFIRKWGTMVRHNQYMLPIIPHKYNIGLIIHNCDLKTLRKLEPYCDTLYVDLKMEYISEYINTEQSKTKFNLSKKIKWIDSDKENDILVEFDANDLINSLDSLLFLTNIPAIISDSGEIGEMEYNIFRLKIKKMNTYEKNLIKLNNDIYL